MPPLAHREVGRKCVQRPKCPGGVIRHDLLALRRRRVRVLRRVIGDEAAVVALQLTHDIDVLVLGVGRHDTRVVVLPMFERRLRVVAHAVAVRPGRGRSGDAGQPAQHVIERAVLEQQHDNVPELGKCVSHPR